jgi:methylated-DNA-[protein]-cysteine S-methyltransferase
MLTFDTALGTVGLSWTAAGIDTVAMPRRGGVAGPRDAAGAPAFVADAVDGIVALLAGEPRDLRAVPVDLSGLEPFQRHVLEATRDVAPGTTATYGEIARTIRVPDAARAVGAALGANPCPIVVPCHRVLGADGRLTGFSAPGGVVTKRRMLEIEGAPGFRQESLFA